MACANTFYDSGFKETMKPLPHTLTGNSQSKQLVVFLHGWPDTLELWGKFLPQFEKDYLILNISYPNFSDQELEKKGANFSEILERLKFSIGTVNQAGRKITFVAHDWGAIFAYLFDDAYPRKLSDLIAVDVAPWFKVTFSIVAYQLWLVKAFLIGGKLGDFMVQSLLPVLKYNPPYKKRIKADWGYLYYYNLKFVLKSLFDLKKIPLSNYEPSCPIAYVYGKNKPAQFQNNRWLEKISADPKNYVKELNAGHWIMNEESEFLLDLIKKRLQKNS